jgi:hypothetical protein
MKQQQLLALLQASCAERRRRKKLEGMHEKHLEGRSLTLKSCTATFERDKMLYYKAIQEPVTQLDFPSILRNMCRSSDDAASRAQILRKSWTRFARSVETQAVRLPSPNYKGSFSALPSFCMDLLLIMLPDLLGICCSGMRNAIVSRSSIHVCQRCCHALRQGVVQSFGLPASQEHVGAK